jgi:hypothetical protein
MARLLVQLKLRLLLNALRSSRAAKVSFIISTMFAVLLAVGTFLVLASYRGKSTSVDLTDSDAIRIGVIWPCAAVYGFALALAGVRLAAAVAAGKMPELCQVAVRSEMT